MYLKRWAVGEGHNYGAVDLGTSAIDIGADFLAQLPRSLLNVCLAFRGHFALDLSCDLVRVACDDWVSIVKGVDGWLDNIWLRTHSQTASLRPGASHRPRRGSIQRRLRLRDRRQGGLLTGTL